MVADPRFTGLPEPDIEHCFWGFGYEDVFRRAAWPRNIATPRPWQQNAPARKVIARAIEDKIEAVAGSSPAGGRDRSRPRRSSSTVAAGDRNLYSDGTQALVVTSEDRILLRNQPGDTALRVFRYNSESAEFSYGGETIAF